MNQSTDDSLSLLISTLSIITQKSGVDVELEIEQISQPGITIYERINRIIHTIERFAEVYCLAADHCSEVVKGDTYNIEFETDESTISRVLECIDILVSRISKSEQTELQVRAQLAHLESAAKESAGECSRLLAENKSLYKNLESAFVSTRSLEEKLRQQVDLSDTNRVPSSPSSTAERELLLRENKNLRERLEQRTKEVELVRADTKITEEIRHKASLHALLEELAAAKARIDELLEVGRNGEATQTDIINGLRNQVENQLEQLQAQSFECSSLKMAIELMQQERDSSRVVAESVQKLLLERETSMHETFCTMDAKEAEIAQLRKTIESLQFEFASLRSQKDLIEKSLMGKLDNSTSQIRSQGAKMSALEQQVSDKNELISSLQAQLHSSQQQQQHQLQHFQHQQQYSDEIDSLRRSLSSVEGERESLREQLQAQSFECSSLQMAIELMQQERDSSRMVAESVQKLLLERETSMHETFCKMDAKEAEIAQLRKTIESLQFDVVSLSSQKDLIEKRMNESSESSTGVVSGLLKKVDSMTTQLGESSAKILVLEQQVSDKNELISSLQAQLHSLQQEKQSKSFSQVDDSLASSRFVGQLELELAQAHSERRALEGRLNSAATRYEALASQLQSRDEEMRALHTSLHIERLGNQNSLAAASQIRVTALTQLSMCSRAIQKDLTTLFGGLEKRVSGTLVDCETKLARLQMKVFRFSSTFQAQRKDRAQTQHMQKLLQHHQQELISSRQSHEDSVAAMTEFLEWLSTLPLTGASEYLSVLSPSTTRIPSGVTPSSSKLPSLIRYAKVQLQGVIFAQQELINEQRKSVREKEMALQESESKFSRERFVSPDSDRTQTLRQPSTGTPNRLSGYDSGYGTPSRSLSRDRPRSAGGTPGGSSRYRERDGSPAVREITRLHTELKNEKARLATLQEQHSDLLSLLAQQELELNAVRDALLAAGGSGAVDRALSKARRTAKSRYGTYVDFRAATNLG